MAVLGLILLIFSINPRCFSGRFEITIDCLFVSRNFLEKKGLVGGFFFA